MNGCVRSTEEFTIEQAVRKFGFSNGSLPELVIKSLQIKQRKSNSNHYITDGTKAIVNAKIMF